MLRHHRVSAGLLGALVACCVLRAAVSSPLDPVPSPLDPPEGTGKGTEASHGEKCADCTAEAVWKGFLKHLQAQGRADLIPPGALGSKEEGEAGESDPGDPSDPAGAPRAPVIDLLAGDPVKGILFKLSPDLVNLDAIAGGADGKPLGAEDAAKARALAEKLRASSDPYLEAYGTLHGARFDLEGPEREKGACEKARAALEGLITSHHFLPRREARRSLAQAYSCLGDDTLALLELQFFLLDVAPEADADRAWAKDELRKIREKEHPGPLHHSEENMRSISESISGLDVGEGTQGKERRVEDILDKVAKLLEQKGGT
ncbi:MAG: hypothetical protein HY721_26275 [Planctomycetes bacterium]|nr:hypothetical protein [Planctomycetota bacterium]